MLDPKTYNFKEVPLDDPLVWSLFKRGDVKGLFQVETPLCKQWCKKIKPSNIDELAATISLIRPGGLSSGFAEKYANVKNGNEKPSYIHISLENILSKYYSCLIYQETILEICQKIAGFSEVQADLARRAVGKKLPEEMMKVEIDFIEGCKKTGIVDEKIAKEIFGWIQKSVAYLFNASHSYSYGYITYFQAYQKRYFPTEFYCSALTYAKERPETLEEISELVIDAKLHNVKIFPPIVSKKNINFTILKDREIIFGLSQIRGIGGSSLENLRQIEKLDTFVDFLKATKKIKRNVSESLIKAGACDCYKISRSYMLRNLYMILGRSEKDSQENNPIFHKLTDKEYNKWLEAVNELGISGALQFVIDNKGCVSKRKSIIEGKIAYLTEISQDTKRQIALFEKLYLGCPLTCSAADDIDPIAENVRTCKEIYFAPPDHKKWYNLHCVLDKIKIRKSSEKSKNPGKEFAIVELSDNSASVECSIWADLYEDVKETLHENAVVSVSVKKTRWNDRDYINIGKITILE